MNTHQEHFVELHTLKFDKNTFQACKNCEYRKQGLCIYYLGACKKTNGEIKK